MKQLLVLRLLCSLSSRSAEDIPRHVVEACASRGLTIQYSQGSPRQAPVLQLQSTLSESKELPFFIDFCSDRMRMRCRKATQELVVRAIRSGQRPPSLVVDFTAGLGRDSLLLAAAGMRVVMVERNPILYSLLQDALARLRNVDPALCSRLSLLLGDAGLIDLAGDRPETVYLDPMYPTGEVGRKANVKKETKYLHRILADEGDDELNNRLLFEKALVFAKHKVVVKRPLHADNLQHIPPQSTIKGNVNKLISHSLDFLGSTHRFDCYLAESFGAKKM